jgi:hypothetical protein
MIVQILLSHVLDLYLVFLAVQLARSCVMLFLWAFLIESVPFEDLLNGAPAQQDLVLFYYVGHLFVLLGRLVLDDLWVVFAEGSERRIQGTRV